MLLLSLSDGVIEQTEIDILCAADAGAMDIRADARTRGRLRMRIALTPCNKT